MECSKMQVHFTKLNSTRKKKSPTAICTSISTSTHLICQDAFDWGQVISYLPLPILRPNLDPHIEMIGEHWGGGASVHLGLFTVFF